MHKGECTIKTKAQLETSGLDENEKYTRPEPDNYHRFSDLKILIGFGFQKRLCFRASKTFIGLLIRHGTFSKLQ